MQFKVDENLPVEVAELLRQAGYDATTVVEQHFGGEADADIAGSTHISGKRNALDLPEGWFW